MEDFICSVCPQSGELPLRSLNSNIIRKAFTPRFKEAGWWGVLQDVSQNICKQYLWHHKYLCRPHKKNQLMPHFLHSKDSVSSRVWTSM